MKERAFIHATGARTDFSEHFQGFQPRFLLPDLITKCVLFLNAESFDGLAIVLTPIRKNGAYFAQGKTERLHIPDQQQMIKLGLGIAARTTVCKAWWNRQQAELLIVANRTEPHFRQCR